MCSIYTVILTKLNGESRQWIKWVLIKKNSNCEYINPATKLNNFILKEKRKERLSMFNYTILLFNSIINHKVGF